MAQPEASVPVHLLQNFVETARQDIGPAFAGAAIGADDGGPAVWLFVDNIGLPATLGIHEKQGAFQDAEHVIFNVWVREVQGRAVDALVPQSFRRIA
ncbi:MAG TPA: hypothetical protein VGU66_16250 [Candidatus Elarobacter sp.]|nr:hypothetical protein [Candidatus Elarobacter sp.]